MLRASGLEIEWQDLSSTISPLAFNYSSAREPSILKVLIGRAQFYHTGPFHNGQGRAKVAFPWERLTGEPLIYASMGTILNGRRRYVPHYRSRRGKE